MYRGTTPTVLISLNTSLTLDDAEQIWVTFKSSTVEKTFAKEDIEVGGNKLIVELSQEDTLSFFSGKVNVQVRFLLNNGKAYASNIKTLDMNQVLKDGEIVAGD